MTLETERRLCMASENLDNLEWLEAWYQRQCDGVWEHELGMNLRSVPQSITTPASGWGLTIELAGTDAADSRPRTLVLDSRDGDWLSCAMTPDRFEGTGDARRLEQIIGVFRRWVDLEAQPRGLRLAVEVPAGD
jgi:hypothetical protein